MSEPAGLSPNASGRFDLDSSTHQGTITRGATVFGSATLLSRVLGLGRDILFAGIFGTSLVFSAFTIAYQVPNMFRKLFGEGALSGAFVPVFTQSIHEKGEKSGFGFAGTMFTVTGLWFSYAFNLTSGATIIMVAAVGFFISLVVDRIIPKHYASASGPTHS